ncbi:hypothetical protein M409DRAFT_70701 [Zasmidium cellare ATCC 36951]|uniref:D-xylose 1-dehydrogenase (NADP(+), D-xylono-1,5-lactone-forming) n=1 Tax=Zasmidium cellare ATCC 36951 TaxID=1080233 RepID=A0A6A6C279_ZASCE|nr:uncharacterized protein M409DRAFT_70701 [Zasmidium cellare ATCC 36951]KAF2159952.1 hypothetical protein M409DRAFT_70701 [Zasmidium cellare ATCC 36951]
MSKYQLKWGILAVGGIAETFARDLTVSPETRGVKDIEHIIVAAAASSSQQRAQAFLEKVGVRNAKAYGSYKELVQDSNVDIIYIATPHSHHYQHAMLCLEAGKNVLCEKAFTTNAAQAKILIEKAREKNLFLMEAAWTRYFPISQYVRDQIRSGAIGTVQRTFADLSSIVPAGVLKEDNRLISPKLAGGVLLDTCIYSLTWVFQTLYSTQDKPSPPQVLSSARKNIAGTDEHTSILLTFPRQQGGDAHGIATASMHVASDADGTGSLPAVRVQGTDGEIQIFHPCFRPTKSRLARSNGKTEEKDWPQLGPGKGSGWWNGFGNEVGKSNNAEGEGHGMFWEADECAYALKDGHKESRVQMLAESLEVMEVMDEVRRQNGIVFPHDIETTDYPVEIAR